MNHLSHLSQRTFTKTLAQLLARCISLLGFCALLLTSASCASRNTPAHPTPASAPHERTTSTQPATPERDSGWRSGDAGIAIRHLSVEQGAEHPVIPLLIVRLNPAAVRLRVAYTPDRPRFLHEWFEQEQPLLAINGGFFDQEYRSTALVISDGVVSGSSYTGFGGMLASADDGSLSLHMLREQPYDSNERFAQAMQSFPMLIFPGGRPSDIEEDGQYARRTAVAIDGHGQLLFIISPTSGFTLRGLADWLAGSDLNIDRALNLDGGPSTGLFMRAGTLNEQIDSLGRLPLVLLVEPT